MTTHEKDGTAVSSLLDIWKLIMTVAEDRDLPPAAIKVAVVLLSHYNTKDGRCFPSAARIARISGLTERSVWRALRELERRGYILKGPNLGGRGRSNRYQPQFGKQSSFSGRASATSLKTSERVTPGVGNDDSGISAKADRIVSRTRETEIENERDAVAPNVATEADRRQRMAEIRELDANYDLVWDVDGEGQKYASVWDRHDERLVGVIYAAPLIYAKEVR